MSRVLKVCGGEVELPTLHYPIFCDIDPKYLTLETGDII